MERFNVNSTCRGCMSTNTTDLHSIFSNNLPELYFSLTSLDISIDDGLPTAICTVCKTNIQIFNTFKLKCIESHSKFMQQLEIVKVKIEEIDIPNNENQIQDDTCKLMDETGFDNDWQNSDGEESKSSNLETKNDNAKIIKKEKEVEVSKNTNKTETNKAKKNETKKNGRKKKQQHQCTLCERSFTHLSFLTRHMKTHTDPTVFECDICKKRYGALSKIRLHIRMVHTTECNCTCEICGKVLVCSSALKKHMMLHSASDERPFECTTCGKKFAREVGLKSHQRFHGPRNYLCPICSKTFFDDNALKNHLNTHTGVRKFACSICNKTFAQSTTRNEHMLVHNAPNEQYPCEICGAILKRQKSFRLHMMRKHMDLPFACDLCDKKFALPFELKVHQQIHRNGGKRFLCSICPMGFQRPPPLKRHMWQVHGRKEF